MYLNTSSFFAGTLTRRSTNPPSYVYLYIHHNIDAYASGHVFRVNPYIRLYMIHSDLYVSEHIFVLLGYVSSNVYLYIPDNIDVYASKHMLRVNPYSYLYMVHLYVYTSEPIFVLRRYVDAALDQSLLRRIWLYFDAEVLVLPPVFYPQDSCFVGRRIFVVNQLPPTRSQFRLLCWFGLSRAGFLSFPAPFPCVFL